MSNRKFEIYKDKDRGSPKLRQKDKELWSNNSKQENNNKDKEKLKKIRESSNKRRLLKN